MKTQRLSPVLLLLALALPLAAEDAPPQPTGEQPAPAATLPPGGKITLEFRGARLGQVLDHLSQEAGLVIINPIELPAPITLVSKQPLAAADAIDALNGVLLDQGYTAILRGKTLRVVTLAAAKQQNLPVASGSDPERIPETDRMVTQIIPVGFATAKDLAENLQPLLGPSATLAANESSNALILTDTQANIRRIASIVQAIDGAVSGEQQIRVFHLVHADAEKVAQVINSIYGKTGTSSNQRNQQQFTPWGGGGQRGGNQPPAAEAKTGGGRGGEVTAAADSGTNSVVIRAGIGALDLLSQVVTELDVDTTSRDGVLVYRVRNGKAADLATSLNSLFQGTQATSTSTTSGTAQRNGGQNRQATGATGAAPAPSGNAAGGGANANANSLDLSGQVRVVADTTSNSVLVLSPERNFERLRAILADLDQPMRQVLVRVLVAEVTFEKGLDLGVQMTAGNPISDATKSNANTDFNLFDSSLGVNGFLLNSGNFHAAIRALESNTTFNVLARPYILTTDNREAVVNVSQEVPVINGSRTDQNNNITSTFDRRDVGVILTLTPQINSDGRVVLDVNQEMSALADQGIPVAEDVESPIINKRTMTTRVAMDKGQTVVIGGLVSDTLTETVRKVPWLGDIPVLGVLFRRTISTKTKTELVVFLTPQVIQDPDELSRLSLESRSRMRDGTSAVEKGLLRRHLDQLDAVEPGQAILPEPVEPTTPPLPAAPTIREGAVR